MISSWMFGYWKILSSWAMLAESRSIMGNKYYFLAKTPLHLIKLSPALSFQLRNL
jgi:hypothetical protein